MRTATATLVACAALLVTYARAASACAPCPDATSGTHQYWQYYSETTWEGGAWVSHIGPEACGSGTPPDGDNEDNQLDGIDLFAYTCRREARHQAANSGWYPNGYDPSIDSGDYDMLPDAQEPTLGGTQQIPLNGGPFVSTLADTNGDDMNDCEEYMVHTQASWTEGSANSSDWANPGHQY